MRFNNDSIREAVREWRSDQNSAIEKYGQISDWDTSQVTDMSELFFEASSFNEPIGNWDVSNVTDMSGMFRNAVSFNQPIANWDVSSVTKMTFLFEDAWEFNQPIGNWDVSNVKKMTRMFRNAVSFNQPLANWDVSNVTDMSGMFRSAGKFNEPIGKWNVGYVTNMESMFKGASSFNQNINSWGTSKVKKVQFMFEGAASFNQPLDKWNLKNVSDFRGMFRGASVFNQSLDAWNMASASRLDYMFCNAHAFNGKIGNWNVSNVTNMRGMFEDATSFNQPIGNWKITKNSEFREMFKNAVEFCQDISNWKINYVPKTMFVGASNFRETYDIPSFSKKIARDKLSSADKKIIAKLKKLFVSRDYSHIDAGIEILRSLNNDAIFQFFLHGIKINSDGELIRSNILSGTRNAQPYLDYVIINLINFSPDTVDVDKSIKRENITHLRLVAESYRQVMGQYELEDCWKFSANSFPVLDFPNLEVFELFNYRKIKSVAFLFNCKNLKILHIPGWRPISSELNRLHGIELRQN
ncbi:BspA family leucine-rich repeat surface protein [Flavobacteriaceae bacterium]|nr:BspA family leucine-rich repeat surface protein [Flavobacteriaceae bacterium]